MMKLKELKGTMDCTATLDSEFTIENRESIAANIESQIQAQGGETYRENNCVYAKGSSQYWRLPTLPKVRAGTIQFRSKDYVFRWTDETGAARESFGSLPKAGDMLDSGFTITMFNGDKIIYTITPKA